VCYAQQRCVYGMNRQTVPCGTVSDILCDTVYIGIWCRVTYGQQCCVYGRNRQTVQCGTVSAVLCDSVYIGIGG